MKILYVNPGRIEAGLDSIIKGPPLALLTISAMVPEHQSKLYDFKVDKDSKSLKKFRSMLKWADVVAITSMTPQIEHAFEVAELAKQYNCITILGGYHPTLEPDYCISHPAVDFIARGEGEHTFKELIDYIEYITPAFRADKKRDYKKPNILHLEQILGISYKDYDGNIIHNKDRPLETNLDNFPIPNYDLVKNKKYLYLGTKVALLETSRGCPHQCEFCCIIKMWRDSPEIVAQTKHENRINLKDGRAGSNKANYNRSNTRYRSKSTKRILQEIYSLDLDRWDFVFFNDDNFTINPKRTRNILQALIKSGLSRKVSFACQSRVDTVFRNQWLPEMMGKAGFKNVFLGIESVHQQSLDRMNKKITVDMTTIATDLFKEYGITIFGGFIIGFPGETIKMVRENIAYAKSLELDFVQFTPITAFPGTPFFKRMDAAGKIRTKNWKYYDLFHSMMDTDQITREEMYGLVLEAYSDYYVSKSYLKIMAKRALFKKQYHWFRKFMFTWTNQFILGGYGMLVGMGIRSGFSKEVLPPKGTIKRNNIAEPMHKRTDVKVLNEHLITSNVAGAYGIVQNHESVANTHNLN